MLNIVPLLQVSSALLHVFAFVTLAQGLLHMSDPRKLMKDCVPPPLKVPALLTARMRLPFSDEQLERVCKQEAVGYNLFFDDVYEMFFQSTEYCVLTMIFWTSDCAYYVVICRICRLDFYSEFYVESFE